MFHFTLDFTSEIFPDNQLLKYIQITVNFNDLWKIKEKRGTASNIMEIPHLFRAKE